MKEPIQAFPMDYRKKDNYGEEYNEGEGGMTLRDYFAAKAMAMQDKKYRPDVIAENCYILADEMMKQREL